MKKFIKQIIALSCFWIYKVISKGKLIIIAYHRILPKEKLKDMIIQPGMYVEKETFKKHIQFLKKNYRILSFPEYLQSTKNRLLRSDERYCIITFDDGWRDNHKYAFPILKKYSVPAMIFLPVSFIGTNKWFLEDRIAYILGKCKDQKKVFNASLSKEFRFLVKKFFDSSFIEKKREVFDKIIKYIKRLRQKDRLLIVDKMQELCDVILPEKQLFLSWDEVKEMSENGIIFGSHGMNHKILTEIPSDEIEHEVKESHLALLNKNINYFPIFCYPGGYYNKEIIKIVSKSGYKMAVTTRFGYSKIYKETYFKMPRILVHQDISSNNYLFSLHLSGIVQFLKFKK